MQSEKYLVFELIKYLLETAGKKIAWHRNRLSKIKQEESYFFRITVCPENDSFVCFLDSKMFSMIC